MQLFKVGIKWIIVEFKKNFKRINTNGYVRFTNDVVLGSELEKDIKDFLCIFTGIVRVCHNIIENEKKSNGGV